MNSVLLKYYYQCYCCIKTLTSILRARLANTRQTKYMIEVKFYYQLPEPCPITPGSSRIVSDAAPPFQTRAAAEHFKMQIMRMSNSNATCLFL